jgi:hypothetical protein
MKSKASFCGTYATRIAENRPRLNRGRALPGPGPSFALRILFHIYKTKPKPQTDISVVIQPDILTCYERRSFRANKISKLIEIRAAKCR